jgi:serine/threonine-protein kinase HipA
MSHDGKWHLSPAYDLTYSVDLSAPAYLNQQSLTVNGKNQDISINDLETVANQNDILDYKSLIERVIDAVSQFENIAMELDIDKGIVKMIKEYISKQFPK